MAAPAERAEARAETRTAAARMASGTGSPAAPKPRRGPTIRSANTSPIALSSGRQNAWKFMRRFCLVGLEILPQFHSLLSVCRSLMVIESRGSAHANPLGREVQNEAFRKISRRSVSAT